MATREPETHEVKETIKRLLAQKRLTYPDLARELGVSLCTIKRILNHEELSLSRFCAIAKALGLTPATLMEATTLQESKEAYHLPAELEEFFVTHTHHWGYLQALHAGQSPGAIARKTGISQASTRRYLRDLEKAGLIRVHPGHKVTVLHRHVGQWSPKGPLSRKWFRTLLAEVMGFLEQFVQRKIEDEEKDQNGMVAIKITAMRTETFSELCKEMSDVFKRYEKRAELESRVDPEDRLETVLMGGFLARDSRVDKVMEEKFGVVELV